MDAHGLAQGTVRCYEPCSPRSESPSLVASLRRNIIITLIICIMVILIIFVIFILIIIIIIIIIVELLFSIS